MNKTVTLTVHKMGFCQVISTKGLRIADLLNEKSTVMA